MTKKKDSRRKVTPAMANKMTAMLNKGKTVTSVANKFGVSNYAVKYNTDSNFRKSEIVRCSVR